MPSTERTYTSPLAGFIEGLIASKRACGYIYDCEAYTLERFDRFCTKIGHDEPLITRDLVAAWAKQWPTEGKSHRSQRVSFVRQLSLYMISLGHDAYVPRNFSSRETPVPYIPTYKEACALFAEIDNYNGGYYSRMADSYRIAFRLMYCCGLRISECSNLAAADFDLENGKLIIRHSKGDKDRIVYAADDLTALAASYWNKLVAELGFAPVWFFPGRNPSKPISKTTYDKKFRQMWENVPGALCHPKRPTPHSLRHAFVINKMNAWMTEGRDLESVMPYLAAYLGHSGPSETFYYYHQVQQAFSVVRGRDAVSARVIPEVTYYEE